MAKMLDACARSVKAQYRHWPSARASQAVAKCRKAKGIVHKSDAGKSLRRWGKERWKDTITGKPCGSGTGKIQYCRPTKKISRSTPAMPRGDHLKALQHQKRLGKHPVATRRV